MIRITALLKLRNVGFYAVVLILSLILSVFSSVETNAQIKTGAENTEVYFPLLKGKKIGIVANQTSVVGKVHLLDTLLRSGMDVRKVFSLEHGFRGNYSDGAEIDNSTDPLSGIPVVSLYGRTKKPAGEDLQDIDLLVFDIQDVGLRCYTYLSSLHYIMEACAENGKALMVLDRPNPNGFYVDGPVLEPEFRSFVGMHPVPLVYGMTIGEYAGMINGEGWLKDSMQCELRVIPCKKYKHSSFYEPLLPPSPNLPDVRAVYLYPSLVFFEGTVISVGRGTEMPFQVYGHPDFTGYDFSFIPRSIPGVSDAPLLEGRLCYGVDLHEIPLSFLRTNREIVLDWLLEAYSEFPDPSTFFTPYFSKIAGTAGLEKLIREGADKYRIRSSWKKDLESFSAVRKKYLLYP